MRIAPPPRMRTAHPTGLPAAPPDGVRARDRRAAGSRGGVLSGRRRPVGARRREGGEPASPGRRGRLRGRAASPFPPQGAARTGPRRRRPRDGGVRRRRHLANSLPTGGVAGDVSRARLIAAASRPQPASHNVLPSVVATCPAHTQAPQPSIVVQSLDVHGLLPAQFPPGTETLHNLCLGLPGSSIPYLLQLLGELLLVSLHRIPVAGISSRSQRGGHLENHNLPVY